MNLHLHRLDPNVPDPVESRRSPAGRFVRLIYAVGVLSVIGFFVAWFGAPAVMLRGPGVVLAPREIVSLPYIVQIQRMKVAPGAAVEAGTPIALVRSPQVNETRSNLTRAIADLTSREADLRVKARIARDTLDAARSRLRIADDTLRRFEKSSGQKSVSLGYRTEIYRERAQAVQSVVALESEAAEASAQLSRLAETREHIEAQLEQLDGEFDDGRVLASVTGIVAPRLAKAGETVVAGSSIAEIFKAEDIYIDWYLPSFRLVDPQPGQKVFVVMGKTRFPGTIDEVLPISDTFDPQRGSILHEPPAGQVARVRLDPGIQAPALNSRVYVHMYYASLTDQIARTTVRFLGLG